MSANTDLSDNAIESVKKFLQNYQTELCNTLARVDGSASFATDTWQREEGGGGVTRTLVGGAVFEKAGVGYSEVFGDSLPPSATAKRPELAGRKWRAMGVSLVIHPLNPHVPVSHANVRLFVAEKAGENPIWWFGGGFDLTPCYGYDEDCVLWHQAASDACAPFGDHLYAELKKECDDYFFLKHRGETRGIGGLFYDDFTAGGFDQSFAFMRSVAEHYLKAYVPIVNKRKDTPYSNEQKQFQCYRRGRYVEFNLVFDRGTLFGLQSGGRTESILMSMPPEAHWQYGYTPDAGSDEERLLERYLRPRDWLGKIATA